MTDFKINRINVHELKSRYDTSPDVCLIDVREDDEWQEMRIPRAVHIPKDMIADCMGKMVPDKTNPIYLHCRGGVRSLYAAQVLLEQGYQSVYSIDGGLVEWANAGYPVEY